MRGEIESSNQDENINSKSCQTAAAGREAHSPMGSDNTIERNGWGGARNSTSRISDTLTAEQVRALEAAAIYAQKIGLHLNTHLTIHLERAGVADKAAMAVIGTFLRMARDGMAKRGQQIAWLFVRENGPGKGSHVHILLHCPPDGARYFVSKQRAWLKRAAGVDRLAPRTIKTKRIGGQIGRYNSNAGLYRVNLAAVVDYVSKGSEIAQGRIVGKRCGASQNIGPAARGAMLR